MHRARPKELTKVGTRTTNKLFSRAIASLKDGFWSDGESLYLRVADGGKRRSWVYRYARGGKVRSIGLGAASEVTLKDARKKRDDLAMLVAQGLDPLVERERATQQRRSKRRGGSASPTRPRPSSPRSSASGPSGRSPSGGASSTATSA
jgi:hypothetical protein